MMEFKDYYITLGVPSNATLQNIKIAYRKLSKKFHPDINDGDKFFEEKFKEIQEAYEVLSNETKRKKYDYRRNSNSKGSKFNNQEYNEYIRKKEEEFEKQKETFRKWEENLKKKEENLKTNADNKIFKRRLGYSSLIIGFITILIIIGFWFTKQSSGIDENKYVLNVPQYDTTSTIIQKEQKEKHLPNYIQKNEQSNSNFANVLDGDWYGKAFQYDVKEYWNIHFVCNIKKNEFKIAYPTLGCSGTWNIENISEKSIDFREYILTGKGNCSDGGLVRLKIVNGKKIECFFYLQNSTTINAKGIITKK